MRWESDAFENQEVSAQIREDLRVLRYAAHPFVDWRPCPGQKLATVSINDYGWRNGHGLEATRKPALTVALFGNSFAWGYGASNEQNAPPALLEGFFREQGWDVRVFALGEQHFTSVQEMKSLTLEAAHLGARLYVFFSGYTDVSAAYRGHYHGHPRMEEARQFSEWKLQAGLGKKFYNFRSLLGLLRTKPDLARNFSPDYMNNLYSSDFKQRYITKFQVADAIAHHGNGLAVHVIQPIMFDKVPLSPWEKEALEREKSDFDDFLIHGFRELRMLWADLKESHSFKNSLFLDSSTYFNEVSETVFFDSVHVSDRGYRLYCRRVVDDILASAKKDILC